MNPKPYKATRVRFHANRVYIKATGIWKPRTGAPLLREVNRLFNVTDRLTGCFDDCRGPRRTEHCFEALVAQRVMALSVGCGDLSAHGRQHDDAALALASGCENGAVSRGKGDDGSGRWQMYARCAVVAVAFPSSLVSIRSSPPAAFPIPVFQPHGTPSITGGA